VIKRRKKNDNGIESTASPSGDSECTTEHPDSDKHLTIRLKKKVKTLPQLVPPALDDVASLSSSSSSCSCSTSSSTSLSAQSSIADDMVSEPSDAAAAAAAGEDSKMQLT